MSGPRGIELGDVCDVIMGQAPPGEAYNDEGRGHPLIAGASDFGDQIPIPRKFTTIAPKLSKNGDIILGIRASIGEKVWADGIYCLGRGVAALRARPQADPRFLWHWLSHNERELNHRARGATFKQVTADDIITLPIQLPTLDEQRRVAAILDEADALRAKRRAALAQLDEMAQAIFLEMFGNPLTNPRRWPTLTASEIGPVVTGNTPSRAVPQNFGTAIEWLKSDNLNTPHYYASRATEGLSDFGRRSARVAPPNSILVTCIAGSPSAIGNSAMLDREAAFNQQINAITPLRCDPHYLYAHLRVGKALVQVASTAAMKGMVTKSRFERLEFMSPPREMQDQFAERALTLEGVRTGMLSAMSDFDSLFASLQHRAFRGEL